MTIALHRVFRTPKDRLVFDVSHQGYVHKLLTGRNDERFDSIRRGGGLSGFLARAESEHDAYGAGHAGTALSAALGMAVARDLRQSDERVVAVCGDAAFTCGITFEALNNVAANTRGLTVILNDNEWSIARNVGAIARYFSRIAADPLSHRLHGDLKSLMSKVPGGGSLRKMSYMVKKEAKGLLFENSLLFENFGLRYLGPIDGHDLDQLEWYLKVAREATEPVLLHVLTQKGKGLAAALKEPEKFHGASPFDPVTGNGKGAGKGKAPAFQDMVGEGLVRLARENPKVVGITAAMPSGTGLSKLERELPEQFFDVGIAEEHAVLFAAGMATAGFRPVVAVYSTFLQRAYDQLIHDVCLQNLPVVFCMDRAGLSPNDGPTHHGLFDIAYLRCIPNAVVLAPANEDELLDMMATALDHQGPVFIRYPRGTAVGVPVKASPRLIEIGKADRLRSGNDLDLWAYGVMTNDALALAEALAEDGISAGVVNARFVKPLDREMLAEAARSVGLLVTLEDHALQGGFGGAIAEALLDTGQSVPLERIGWPDTFIGHGSSVEELRRSCGLDLESLRTRVLGRWRALPQAAGQAVHVEAGHSCPALSP